jgi:hypothetical protein
MENTETAALTQIAFFKTKTRNQFFAFKIFGHRLEPSRQGGETD